jgi:hypothetical protein
MAAMAWITQHALLVLKDYFLLKHHKEPFLS